MTRQPTLFERPPVPAISPGIDVALAIGPELARELAISQQVCVRPVLRRVEDRFTGSVDHVAIPCGSTRDTVCPPCAHKAKVVRMHQCKEGWHRDHEPDPPQPHADRAPDSPADADRTRPTSSTRIRPTSSPVIGGCGRRGAGKMRRTCPGCRGRTRTIGRTFTSPRTAWRIGRRCS